MQNDRNSGRLVVHPPPSGNYTGEKNQNCLNTPGGFSCTSDISYLVPSCGCQTVSQGVPASSVVKKEHSAIRFRALTGTPSFPGLSDTFGTPYAPRPPSPT